MTPSHPTSFGPYRIVAPLGSGGMGEVFRARDPRLQRDVAIKVLNEEFAANPDRRSRFEREARAVAALNHPNIVALYDIGEENGRLFMVSELVPGETIRALFRKGPVPMSQVIDIAMQTAAGMSAAHDAGITHRDLKPENIMLTGEGTVKILDFGLARQDKPTGEFEQTMTVQHTRAGVVMGTASYMSPEQARGQGFDYRTDQFSFGLVIYEMLTGARPFERDTSVQTMAAILTDDPPLLPKTVPAPLRWIVERCLAKDPRQRYTSTRDLYQELRHLREHLSELTTLSATGIAPAIAPGITAPRRSRKWVLWPLAAIALLAAGAAIGMMLAGRTSPVANPRYTPFAVTRERQGLPVWSPDGQAVAYSGLVGSTNQVFLRYLNAPNAAQLTHGADNAVPIGWTGDSKTIYLLGQLHGKPRALYSLPVFGGEPELVMPLKSYFATVSRDGGTLAIIHEQPDHVISISTSSPIGSPLKRYAPAPFETRDAFNGLNLSFSPDGKKILYCVDTRDARQIWLLPWPAGSAAPRKILTGISKIGNTPSASWFPDNRHLILSLQLRPHEPQHLYSTGIDSGNMFPITAGVGTQYGPAMSPDGTKIVYVESQSDLNVVTASLSDASVSQLISTERIESMPAWSSGQNRLVYVTNRNGPQEIWLRDPDDSQRPLVTESAFPPDTSKWWMNPTLSPDGNRVTYMRADTSNNLLLWISSVSGGPPVRLTNDNRVEHGGAWSPDGQHFAYVRLSSGKQELAIVRTTGQATPVIIRTGDQTGGTALPDWSPAGEWITWRDQDGWTLISPDGKNAIGLGKIASDYLAFSKNGKLLYGIRKEPPQGYLFSLDWASKRVTTIGDVGRENEPATDLMPGIRFSLTPDGSGITYATAVRKTNLWMIEGFPRP